ncbi:hypothetical protein Halhy_0159 [Haliscomenobacter hydrossis DSM 1100]|uniref:Uncharacterized protein n=1 Tax=Haliscomenobacter hydrossis (strain ATCC 27775 / DSM 1100 / LMG 10767 / O) TaxID=760192 RepID=F4KTS8_HALH1|nr:hypothetical protein Halhy_0159 [Haliscomenobacter hydrossis DSM 1100]
MVQLRKELHKTWKNQMNNLAVGVYERKKENWGNQVFV